jgi:hypothetical protein
MIVTKTWVCSLNVVVLATVAALTALVKADELSPASFTKSTTSKKIIVNKDDFIAEIHSYDHGLSVVITSKYFQIVSLENGNKVMITKEKEHHIQNAVEDYISSFCAHGMIGFIKRHVMHIFRLTDNRKDIRYNISFPAEYFNVTHFTENYAVNPWSNSLAMKIETIDTKELYVFDFRVINKPTAKRIDYLVNSTNLEANITLRFLLSGQILALQGKRFIDFENIVENKRLRLANFPSDIVTTNYLTDGSIYYVLVRANNTLNLLKYQIKKLKIDLLKFELNDLNEHLIDNKYNGSIRLMKTGLDIVGVMTSTDLTFLNLKNGKWINKPTSLGNSKDEISYDKIFRLSNILQKRTYLKNSKEIKFEFMEIKPGGYEFLHPTCYRLLNFPPIKPFVPCSVKPMILGSLAISSVVVYLVMFSVRYCANLAERQDNFNSTTRYKKALRKAQIEVDQDTNTLKVKIDSRKVSDSMLRPTFLSKLQYPTKSQPMSLNSSIISNISLYEAFDSSDSGKTR